MGACGQATGCSDGARVLCPCAEKQTCVVWSLTVFSSKPDSSLLIKALLNFRVFLISKATLTYSSKKRHKNPDMFYLMHAYYLKGKVNFFTKFGQNTFSTLILCPPNMSICSWILADILTEKCNLHCNPGSLVPFGSLHLHAKPAEKARKVTEETPLPPSDHWPWASPPDYLHEK